MALVSCRECSKEVSGEAKTCPHCGVNAPWQIKQDPTFPLVMLAIAAVLLIYNFLFGEDDVSNTAQKAAQPTKVSQHQESTLASKYEANWNTSPLLAISQSLVKSKIRNCGEYKYKQSRTHQGEYVVYCTRDGTNWVSYLVWTGTKKVMGPYDIDPSLGT